MVVHSIDRYGDLLSLPVSVNEIHAEKSADGETASPSTTRRSPAAASNLGLSPLVDFDTNIEHISEALIVPKKPIEMSDIYGRSQRTTETPKQFLRDCLH